jgi:UDP-N-acetylmuramoyl-tripeptide--D-alanyl-D-alanine ligase
MKLGDIADILGSNIRTARGATELAEREPSGYSIDSRAIAEGELFIAIRGENHDGHRFVADAIGRRAVAAIVSRGFIDSEFARQLDPQRAALVMVEDTLAALQSLASAVIRGWRGKVVAITGSLGKTTTKEITAAMLARAGRVVKTTGNLNNDFGLPLSILQMESGGHRAWDFDFAVLEMGMNHKGEIARLAGIAPPDVGVVTIVAPAHLEFFASIDEIAEAKSEMVQGIVPGGVAVLNGDDERVSRMGLLRPDVGCVRFGIDQQTEVRATQIDSTSLSGSHFVLVTPRGQVKAFLPLAGRHSVYNALAAAAVADTFQIPLDQISDALAETQAPKMRGQVLRFRDGFTLIDDSYNSNPRALIEMVSTLFAGASAARRIVVAGEMLELGSEGARLHREAGRQIAKLGVDRLIGVCGLGEQLAAGAREGGMSESAASFVDSSEEAARVLVRELRPGDLVLVKGSRGVKTEIVVEAVKQRFERATRDAGTATSEPREESLRQLA